MISAKTLRRWLPLALLVVLALIAWNLANAYDTDEASTEPIFYEQQLGSPVLSARRVPQTLQAPLARDALAPSVQTILNNSTPDTCLIVSVDGRILGQQNPEQPLVPASNQKVVSTYAALQTLGGDRTFRTIVRADANIIDGVLEGNLYFVGGGDPFLSTDGWANQYDEQDGRARTRLEDLADDIAATGLTQVTGSLIGDETFFDDLRTGEWATRLIDSRQSGPLSALAVNEGFLGWPATYEGSSRPRVPAPDPALQAAEVLAQLLTDRGISVGSVSTGMSPLGLQELAAIESPPMIELITYVNSYSNNFGAEMLLKHLGREVNGDGTTIDGAAAVVAFLKQKGLPTTGINIVDGSGLAETNTLTCNLLAAILADAGADSAFAGSLSIGGERGSLMGRHVDTPATGNVRAKTGTLNGVTALSGYADSAVDDGVTLVFTYIVNGELAGQDESIRSQQAPFVEQLVSYPDAPSVDLLVPLATVASAAPVLDPTAADE